MIRRGRRNRAVCFALGLRPGVSCGLCLIAWQVYLVDGNGPKFSSVLLRVYCIPDKFEQVKIIIRHCRPIFVQRTVAAKQVSRMATGSPSPANGPLPHFLLAVSQIRRVSADSGGKPNLCQLGASAATPGVKSASPESTASMRVARMTGNDRFFCLRSSPAEPHALRPRAPTGLSGLGFFALPVFREYEPSPAITYNSGGSFN